MILTTVPFKEIFSAGDGNCPPALLTKKSNFPNFSTAVDINLLTCNKGKHVEQLLPLFQLLSFFLNKVSLHELATNITRSGH